MANFGRLAFVPIGHRSSASYLVEMGHPLDTACGSFSVSCSFFRLTVQPVFCFQRNTVEWCPEFNRFYGDKND